MREQGTATQLQPVKKEIGPIRASSFDEILDEMRETFDSIARRAYELFESNGRQPGHDLDNWFRAENEFLRPTPVEVREANGSVQVRAEVPGFEPKDLEVSIEPTRLTIAGKRETTTKEDKENVLYSECRANQLYRSVPLPVEVNAEKATATLKQGILELTLPKATSPKKVKIVPNIA
jgi:HSP20 family protein